jgi:hypothetical protein
VAAGVSKRKLKKAQRVLSREEVIKRTITSRGGRKLRARRRGSKDMLLLVMIHIENCHLPAKKPWPIKGN